MKKIIIIFLISCFLNSCVEDDSILGKEMIFSGVVLFEDNREPVDGEIEIIGFERRFPSNSPILTGGGGLDEIGGFNASFDTDLEIDFFVIGIWTDNQEDILEITNCGGFEDCNKLSKTGNYEDMIILVERPE